MKFLGLLIATVLCMAGSCTADTKLSTVFFNGAKAVPELHLPQVVDGEDLRNKTLLVLTNYLSLLDVELSRLMTWGVRDILQPCDLRFREILDLQQYVGPAAPSDLFDYQLSYLGNAFRYLVNILPTERNVQHVSAHKPTRVVTPTPRYTLNNLFNELDGVLTDDFTALRAWWLQVFDAGYAAAKDKFNDIQEEGRHKHLWAAVKSLQRDVNFVQKYDESLQQYSSEGFWESYLDGREKLLAVQVPEQ